MRFAPDCISIALFEMSEICPALRQKYATVIRFLAEFPAAASGLRGKSAPTLGTHAYIKVQAAAFKSGRDHRAPAPPATVPDPMVSVILEEYFGLPKGALQRAKTEHSLSMGAENLVGDLLERYIASIAEEHGWVWCSGAIVKAVDFIKPPKNQHDAWRLLQVKNRDNSENSSSSAIRVGTTIEKWHRSFSKKEALNWAAFPDHILCPLLSESGFEAFVRAYLLALKPRKNNV